MNKVSTLFLLSTMLFNTSQNNEFLYQYEITASSNSSKDILEMYNQKEKFINKYNLLFDTVDEKSITQVLKQNIINFSDENIQAYFQHGKIVLVIGNGKGMTINGHLKSSECDDNVINHKLYIIDWLFNKDF